MARLVAEWVVISRACFKARSHRWPLSDRFSRPGDACVILTRPDRCNILLHLMAGPTDPRFALVWVADALDQGRYLTTRHFELRCAQRQYSIFDAKKVVQTATRCEPYP